MPILRKARKKFTAFIYLAPTSVMARLVPTIHIPTWQKR
jgi:hypothetical protein